MRDALIILVKNPIKGRAKTRLAQSIGDEAALNIYRILLDYTRKTTEQLSCAKLLFYSDSIDTNDEWDPNVFQKFLQTGQDFGERMHNAFSEALKRYKRVQIIGSDCYEITSEIINDGFQMLETHDIVIGPAEDGGYYLLGMKKLVKDFFINKPWSTASIFNDTITDITRLKLSYGTLPCISDIDEVEDLMKSRLIEDYPELNSIISQ